MVKASQSVGLKPVSLRGNVTMVAPLPAGIVSGNSSIDSDIGAARSWCGNLNVLLSLATAIYTEAQQTSS